MEENVEILNPGIIFGAAALLFNEEVHDFFYIYQNPEKKRHLKINNYFEEVIPLYCLSDFKSHFRLSRRTFQRLTENFGPLLYEYGRGTKKMCPEKQLCIAIWIFANQKVYRSVADRFGVSKDTAWKTAMTVARVLNKQASNYIRWPVGQEVLTVEQDFAELAGFPGVVAAVDGTHVEVNAPSNEERAYINRKSYHSVILQGMCNANKKFVDVFTGVCGSVHDARVWHMSHIKEAIENDPDRYCPGERHILGDSAYPIQYHLLPPYRDNGHLTATESNYNTVHSKTRVVIENTFALLKGRFRRLKFLYVQYIEYAPLIILACCVLHNICIDLEDDIPVEEIDDVGNDDIGEQQHGRDFVAAVEKRDVLAELLMEQRRNV